MELETTAKRLRGPVFTKENARLFALRGVAARARNKAQAAIDRLKPPPLPPLPEAILAAQAALFCEKRILRVRKQLDSIDAMIAQETDPQRLDRLASAQSRVSEQERILSGRPLPGSQRPRLAKPAKSSGLSVEPE